VGFWIPEDIFPASETRPIAPSTETQDKLARISASFLQYVQPKKCAVFMQHLSNQTMRHKRLVSKHLSMASPFPHTSVTIRYGK